MTVAVALLLAVTTPTPAAARPVFDPATRAGEAMLAVKAFVDDADQVAVDAALAELLDQAVTFVRSAAPPPPPPVPVRSVVPPPTTTGPAGGGGGDCYAGPIPAAIVTRESGGNPTAVNSSSGAYGCFQIMPYVWAANCPDLDRGVGGQITCAGRISNGGRNLGPWAG